jgi:hypothetical protein
MGEDSWQYCEICEGRGEAAHTGTLGVTCRKISGYTFTDWALSFKVGRDESREPYNKLWKPCCVMFELDAGMIGPE